MNTASHYHTENMQRMTLSLHLAGWELRRLLLPTVAWLLFVLPAAWYINHADWSWPHYSEHALREDRESAQSFVEAGLYLSLAVAAYFIGELFLPLRPGAVRGRFAWPVDREEALKVSLLIGVTVVLLPLMFYFSGWLITKGWDDEPHLFRQYLPLPLAFAGLMLAALTAGDWGVYLLTAALTLLGVVWTEKDEHLREPLHIGPALLLTVLALAAAFAGQRWLLRWPLYGAWALLLLLALRGW